MSGGLDATDDAIVLRDPDPTSWARESAVAWADDWESGRVVAWMLAHGVRWSLLRWIRPDSRWAWYEQLIKLTPPPGTRACVEGREVWLDHVVEVISSQPWQKRRKDKWLAIAHAIAYAVPLHGGAITRDGCTYPELAEAAGCCLDYVADIVEWFVQAGLLHIVVPGTRKKPMPQPEDETPEEAAAREAYEQRLAAHTEARAEELKRAKAQLREQINDEMRTGAIVVQLDPFRDTVPAPELPPSHKGEWINVAQVYQLRLPAPPEPSELPAEAWGRPKVASLGKARQRRAQRRRGTLTRKAVQPGRTAALPGQTENSSPNADHLERDRPCSSSAVVEKRAASPRSDEGASGQSGGSKRTSRPGSRVVRAAQRLLGVSQSGHGMPSGRYERLPLSLRGVGVAWLARRIAPYVVAGWTDEQLVQLIAYDSGRKPSCPPDIPNPRGFVVNALRRQAPSVPFRSAAETDELRQAVDVEVTRNDDAQQLREQNARRIARLVAAAADCDQCDDEGFRQITGPRGHLVVQRCTHDEPEPQPEPTEPKPPASDEFRERLMAQARAADERRRAAAAAAGEPRPRRKPGRRIRLAPGRYWKR
jgi:hypothetical protein